ncbi:MAG TPA: hotdog domain-containing protein [Terriglobales bacterium]|nr:hotdog domain-containing protein [Terriglobales bacterium]
MPKPIPIGTRQETTRTVEFKNTLTSHHEKLPPVLTTPDMIGWMEFACYLATEPFCEGDETTVGTAIHVRHLAPTGIGSIVTAEAVLEKIEGRFYIFKVSARDELRVIGDGHVHRAFVNYGKFVEKQGVKK